MYTGRYNGKKVALKTLFDPKVDAALKQEFMDELFVMSKLSHPNVVDFYGACLKPPDLCFIMELCDCSLYDILHNNNTNAFTLHRRISMCLDIAAGLKYLHDMTPAVVHRLEKGGRGGRGGVFFI